MKFFLACFNILICVLILSLSAIGLTVHRAHSISTAAEIAKTYNISDDKRDELVMLVMKTGNTKFYYSNALTAAEVGVIANFAVIIYSAFTRRKEASVLQK